MVEVIESCVGLSISQIGLVLDIFGFVIIFVYGCFQFGVSAYVSDEYKWYVLPLRIFGSLLVLTGFFLQIVGSGQ